VIYIIEQSADGREFNRGKLLNIGFKLACSDNCNIFIFHDVDLMPSAELHRYYTTIPTDKKPVHIARRWNRYSNNPSYFGGIVAFSKQQFSDINGYPNNFWGWGGEDDELKKRADEVTDIKFDLHSPLILSRSGN
jgi:predicted glycosyltransferase involved in capsule biosynthesis